MNTFDHWMALYRARVKEKFYYQTSQWPVTYSELILTQPDKATILVIEDDIDEWFLLRWTLSKQFPTAEIEWCSSTPQTLAYLERYTFSEQSLPVMILLDLYLPSTQASLSLLQKIKSHDRLASVPIVMISRSNYVEEFNSASDAFLTKPADYRAWPVAFALLNQYWPDSGTLV